MDAKEYDRIADLLLQIRKKYKLMTPEHEFDKKVHARIIKSIDTLLLDNEYMAITDAKGLI